MSCREAGRETGSKMDCKAFGIASDDGDGGVFLLKAYFQHLPYSPLRFLNRAWSWIRERNSLVLVGGRSLGRVGNSGKACCTGSSGKTGSDRIGRADTVVFEGKRIAGVGTHSHSRSSAELVLVFLQLA